MGKGQGRVGSGKGVRKETARKKRSARIEGQREQATENRGAKTDRQWDPPVIGEEPCALAALLGEGPSTLLSWSRTGRSCPFRYRGALSFLRLHAGPAWLVVVGTRPEKGSHSGHTVRLQPSSPWLAVQCSSPLVLLHLDFQFFPAGGAGRGQRKGEKESKPSSAVRVGGENYAGCGGLGEGTPAHTECRS